MSDLIEWLRDLGWHIEREAADEIERLTERGDIGWAKAKDLDARIERLETEVQKWMDLYGRVQEENSNLAEAAIEKPPYKSDLQARIERLEAELKGAWKDHEMLRKYGNYWSTEAKKVQARVETLEKVRVAVLKHRDNKEFLNIDTWNACVYAAEAATEQGDT